MLSKETLSILRDVRLKRGGHFEVKELLQLWEVSKGRYLACAEGVNRFH